MTPRSLRLPHVSPAGRARITTMLGWLQALSPHLAARLAFWLFLRPQRRELAQADAAFMVTSKLHRIVAGTDTVQVYEWGNGPRTVLIAHGWGSRASRFAPMAAALAARGWRVLALDAPGHGLSAGSSSSLPQFMAVLDGVATQLGPVHALIGHSLGALAVACKRAAGRPAWMDSLRKLVLIAMPSGVPFLVDAFHGMFRINSATAGHMQARFRRRFGTDPASFFAHPDAIAQEVPTLVVHDREDDIVPFSHGEGFLSGLRGARLLATQGLGHSALTRDAATINAIADFLDEGDA